LIYMAVARTLRPKLHAVLSQYLKEFSTVQPQVFFDDKSHVVYDHHLYYFDYIVMKVVVIAVIVSLSKNGVMKNAFKKREFYIIVAGWREKES
jgi:hypothetical protein